VDSRAFDLTAAYSNCASGPQEIRRKEEIIVYNNYETPEAIELDRAQDSIRGQKESSWFDCDIWLGCGWRTTDLDIDESDE